MKARAIHTLPPTATNKQSFTVHLLWALYPEMNFRGRQGTRRMPTSVKSTDIFWISIQNSQRNKMNTLSLIPLILCFWDIILQESQVVVLIIILPLHPFDGCTLILNDWLPILCSIVPHLCPQNHDNHICLRGWAWAQNFPFNICSENSSFLLSPQCTNGPLVGRTEQGFVFEGVPTNSMQHIARQWLLPPWNCFTINNAFLRSDMK